MSKRSRGKSKNFGIKLDTATRGSEVFTRLASLSILSLFTRTLAGPVSALVTSRLDVVASGNGCKEYLWIVVSEDCYVASRADLLPRGVELRGRPTAKGSRSTAGERRAACQVSFRERRRPTAGERRAVR